MRPSSIRPAAVIGWTLALYLAFAGVRLSRHGFDPAAFIVAGSRYCDGSRTPVPIPVLEGSPGYDGQFFCRLALDPLASSRTARGIAFDVPPYRHQRILYPALAWALSFGRASLVPAALIIVNLAALALLGLSGALLARRLGRPAAWGMLLPLFPGLLITLSRDLSEIVAACLLVGFLAALRRGKGAAAAGLLALGVLTKETVVLAAIAAFISWVRDRWSGRPGPGKVRWYLWSVPLAVALAWQTVLFLVWGQVPVLSGKGALGLPLRGVGHLLADILSQRSGLLPAQRVLWSLEILFLCVFVACTARALRRSTAGTLEKAAWVSYLALVLCLGDQVWVNDLGFLRASTEMYVFGCAVLLGLPDRRADGLPRRLPDAPLWAVGGGAAAIWAILFILRGAVLL